MATGYPEVEEQEGTRIEKVLLAALVIFLLVGGFWALQRIEGVVPEPVLQNYAGGYVDNRGPTTSVEDELGVNTIRNRVSKLEEIANNRAAELGKAEAALQKADSNYKFRREEYRTAMQAGHASEATKVTFESSRSAFQTATAAIPPLQFASDQAAKESAKEIQVLNAAQQRSQDVYQARSFQRNIKLFALHFGFAGLCLGLSWVLWQAGRQRRWRYQTILTALFTASLLQLLFLLFRYCWGLFLEDFAVLGVAAVGTVVCILAIIGIKRWLFAPARLAQMRLASSRCPTCSTSFTESQSCCWHCGNRLVEKCPSCGERRLIFAPHCGNCGAGIPAEANPGS